MQDGATPHTAGDTITLLQRLFRNRLIALHTAHDWAPHSPDLSPLGFWFWGFEYVKGEAFGGFGANTADTGNIIGCITNEGKEIIEFYIHELLSEGVTYLPPWAGPDDDSEAATTQGGVLHVEGATAEPVAACAGLGAGVSQGAMGSPGHARQHSNSSLRLGASAANINKIEPDPGGCLYCSY